jgi:hypothetical protein
MSGRLKTAEARMSRLMSAATMRNDMLDHATSEIASGSKLGIDATKKIPGEGFKRAWPPLWLKERGRDYADFEWQDGYADFSVSQSNLEPVNQYIAGQEEHHRKIGFQDELRALLKRPEIEWDEKYVWD